MEDTTGFVDKYDTKKRFERSSSLGPPGNVGGGGNISFIPEEEELNFFSSIISVLKLMAKRSFNLLFDNLSFI